MFEMSGKEEDYIGFPQRCLGEIPIDSMFIIYSAAKGGCNEDARTEVISYFLGDLTPSTRLSKACLAGVAVEADDICTESQDMW